MRKYSKETKDKILALWNANMSSQYIADQFGLTKNMVVGIVHKMRNDGFHVRVGKSFNKQSKLKSPKVYKTKKSSLPLSVETSEERWVPLLHLGNNTCRYTKDIKLFCNAPCTNNNSYCEEHASQMYSGYHSMRVNLRSFVL